MTSSKGSYATVLMLVIKVPIVASFEVISLVTELYHMATTGYETFVISFAYNGLTN